MCKMSSSFMHRSIQWILICEIMAMSRTMGMSMSLQGRTQCHHPSSRSFFQSGQNTLQVSGQDDLIDKQPEKNLNIFSDMRRRDLNDIRDDVVPMSNEYNDDDIENELRISMRRKSIPDMGFWPHATSTSALKGYLYQRLDNMEEQYHRRPQKKTENTFYGVRGKKYLEIPSSNDGSFTSRSSLRGGLLQGSHGLHGLHGSHVSGSSTINDVRDFMHLELHKTPLSSSSNIILRIPGNDSHKRTPIGFMGLRGKRASSSSSSVQAASGHYPTSVQDARILQLEGRMSFNAPDATTFLMTQQQQQQIDQFKRKYAEFWRQSSLHDLYRRSSATLPSTIMANLLGKKFVAVRGKKDHNQLLMEGNFHLKNG